MTSTFLGVWAFRNVDEKLDYCHLFTYSPKLFWAPESSPGAPKRSPALRSLLELLPTWKRGHQTFYQSATTTLSLHQHIWLYRICTECTQTEKRFWDVFHCLRVLVCCRVQTFESTGRPPYFQFDSVKFCTTWNNISHVFRTKIWGFWVSENMWTNDNSIYVPKCPHS